MTLEQRLISALDDVDLLDWEELDLDWLDDNDVPTSDPETEN